MGTPIYDAMMTRWTASDHDYAPEMIKTWEDFPWVVDAHTGSVAGDRMMITRVWCYNEFGREAWDGEGSWLRANSTVNGWTLFGFKTEAQMNEFCAVHECRKDVQEEL